MATAVASTYAPRPQETLQRLPLVTLVLTDRCNSRCITCDYWRNGRDNLSLQTLRPLLPELEQLGTRVALLSGGEPLLNPEWREMAETLACRGIQSWLLTSGLSLAKYAGEVAARFAAVTVSLDGTSPPTYRAIRGLDAFARVCEGVRAAVAAGATVSLRVTLQRSNYLELPRFVRLARELGVRQVSFLAVDVSNPHAFARNTPTLPDLALHAEDVARFECLLDDLEAEFADEFASGFIAETPAKLRRLAAYFRALLGAGEFPPTRCNAPEISAVVGARGAVSPCVFIPGPPRANVQGEGGGLRASLDSPAMSELRARIRAGDREECRRCVCTLWRDPRQLDAGHFLLGAHRA